MLLERKYSIQGNEKKLIINGFKTKTTLTEKKGASRGQIQSYEFKEYKISVPCQEENREHQSLIEFLT